MFRLFSKSEEDKEKDLQVLIGTGIANNNSIKQMTAQADAVYKKPEYNPTTRRESYDAPSAHVKAKKRAFSKGSVKDPYSGDELFLTKNEAKMKYGNDWQKHLAEADHIEPLNKIANRSKDKAWIKSEDIKDIANSPDNMQVISRHNNQTGGKGGSTQQEWSSDYDKMKRISEQTGESVEAVSAKVRKVGEDAKKINDKKLLKASIKNVADTAHTAGKATAVNAGGYAATISGIYNISSCIRGEKTVSEALIDTGVDSSKAAVGAYASGAGMTVLNHTLTSSKSTFIRALGENNVAGNVITTVAITGGTVVKWGNGEISTEECLVELGDKGCNFGGAYLGGIAGQALIPIPIVGGAIGSLVGGTLSSGVYNLLVQDIRDGIEGEKEEARRREREKYEAMVRYYAEQQRREEVQQLIKTNTKIAVLKSVDSIICCMRALQDVTRETSLYFEDYEERERRIAECVLVTLQMREYHRQLQEYSDNYFARYENCFAQALELMDASLAMGDYDGATDGVNRITEMFGKKPIIKNKEDFKRKIFNGSGISF